MKIYFVIKNVKYFEMLNRKMFVVFVRYRKVLHSNNANIL